MDAWATKYFFVKESRSIEAALYKWIGSAQRRCDRAGRSLSLPPRRGRSCEGSC